MMLEFSKNFIKIIFWSFVKNNLAKVYYKIFLVKMGSNMKITRMGYNLQSQY